MIINLRRGVRKCYHDGTCCNALTRRQLSILPLQLPDEHSSSHRRKYHRLSRRTRYVHCGHPKILVPYRNQSQADLISPHDDYLSNKRTLHFKVCFWPKAEVLRAQCNSARSGGLRYFTPAVVAAISKTSHLFRNVTFGKLTRCGHA
jgi:hypothetical protein